MTETQALGKDETATHRAMSRGCARGLYAMFAIWGAIQIAFPENGGIHYACALLNGALASGWMHFDARSRGIAILPVLQMLYFFLWPIGAVIYLVYRSGFRGLLIAALHGIGLLATLAVVLYTTFYGLHFAGMLDASFYQ